MSLLSQALFSAQSSEASIRESSLQLLTDLSHKSPPNYILELSAELAAPASPSQVRQLAGLLLKNSLFNLTKDPLLERVWDHVDPQSKALVRSHVLGSLASEDKDVRLISAQAVAAVASLDIPQGQWLDVLSILVTNSTNLNRIFRVSAIRTLGYICDALPQGTVVKTQADAILTALASNLDNSETDREIKIVALTALRNSLKFISANIANDSERGIVLGLLYGCCQSNDVDQRKEAMMIICDVLSLYYDYLQGNLMELGSLTYNIIKNDQIPVAIYGIEFWNQAADEEIERLRLGDKPVKNYIHTAAASLTPLLLEKIVIIEEDSDEWSIHKACASTIGSISLIIRDQILDFVGGFISESIKAADWRLRVSASVIIGSILEGVADPRKLIEYTVRDIFALLNDQKKYVKETASWTISKICEFHPQTLINILGFQGLMTQLLQTLKESPKTATHSCWAMVNIFSNGLCNEFLNAQSVEAIINALIETALRPDAHSTEHDLLLAAYSALNKMTEEISEQLLGVVIQKIPVFMKILQDSVNKEHQNMIQGHVCSAVQTTFGRAQPGSIDEQIADGFVQLIIQIFNHRGTIVEEGLQALGTLADNIQGRFIKYADVVVPFVEYALRSTSNSIAKSGAITVSDLSRGLGDNFIPYLKTLLPIVLHILADEQISFEVKIRAIDALADFASHSCQGFCEYLNDVFKFIDGAAEMSLNLALVQGNPDMQEYMGELRESIASFYVGIVQGTNDLKRGDLILGYLPKIVDYGLTIGQEEFKPSGNIHMSVAGIIGDIAAYYETKAAAFLKVPRVTNHIARLEALEDKGIKEVILYAQERLKHI